MIITDIRLETRSLPLKTPFITAKRRLDVLKYYTVDIMTDNGLRGTGSCSPTPVITGDTDGSIIYAINDWFTPRLIGREVTPELLPYIKKSLYANTSPKAALDIAVHDLLAKQANTKLVTYLGGSSDYVDTDVTVSIGNSEKVASDIARAIDDGFRSLKIKLGRGRDEDLGTIREISAIVPPGIRVRFDANQAWGREDSVYIISHAAELPLQIDLFEQPVDADDIDGMSYVTANTPIDILADESVFDSADAIRVIKAKAADLINIKLMKCGGIYEAKKIYEAAAQAGIGCMVGCMMEGPESVLAAAQFAAAAGITLCDLDAPFLCSYIPEGTGKFEKGRIHFD